MLEKSVWTEADYDVMGWHDATLWALAFDWAKSELSLDIDYISWVQPDAKDPNYRFWVAPATLVFHNIYDLDFDLSLSHGSQIDDLTRSDARTPRNADYIDKNTEWLWTIGIRGGTLTLRSVGFTQFIRQRPVLGHLQALSLEARGGISFGRVASTI